MTTVEEFRHLGPCPTCGQHRWEEAVCLCSHGVTRHDFGTSKGETVRTKCSHHACGCKSFRPKPVETEATA